MAKQQAIHLLEFSSMSQEQSCLKIKAEILMWLYKLGFNRYHSMILWRNIPTRSLLPDYFIYERLHQKPMPGKVLLGSHLRWVCLGSHHPALPVTGQERKTTHPYLWFCSKSTATPLTSSQVFAIWYKFFTELQLHLLLISIGKRSKVNK